jgi:1-acyl-sn-glycerol-3-phosphate acyltransferase
MRKAVRTAERIIFLLLSLIIFPLQFGITGLCVVIMLPFGYLGIYSVLPPIMRFVSWSIFLSSGKIIHVYGKKNIRPDKNYILLANHAGYHDVPAIMSFIPSLSWLGKDRFLKIPVFGTFLKFIKFIPVYPGYPEKSRQAIDKAIATARQLTIAIFPEGTRTYDGRLSSFKKGFVHIMRGSDLDILPITLNGFFTYMPRHRWIINPFVRLEAIVHPPIKREDILHLSNEEIVELVHCTIASVYHDQSEWLFPGPKRIQEAAKNKKRTTMIVKAMDKTKKRRASKKK